MCETNSGQKQILYPYPPGILSTLTTSKPKRGGRKKKGGKRIACWGSIFSRVRLNDHAAFRAFLALLIRAAKKGAVYRNNSSPNQGDEARKKKKGGKKRRGIGSKDFEPSIGAI